MRYVVFLGLLLAAGCASTKHGEYRPKKSNEKAAFARADRTISPNDVRAGFQALRNTEVAWAGIITDVQYEEKERVYQVAFEVEHRPFDWRNHGGSQPFRLGSEGVGGFVAGWYANKPTSIWRLRQLADVGDMIIVYGKPYRMRDGVIQLAATAVRPVQVGNFEVVAQPLVVAPSTNTVPSTNAAPSTKTVPSTNAVPTEKPRHEVLEFLDSLGGSGSVGD